MIRLRKMTKVDIPIVLKWNTGGSDFLMQWSDFMHPLTESQLQSRVESPDYHVFIIENNEEPSGTIQIFRINRTKRTAWIGCFLVDAAQRGKGTGKRGLLLAVSYAVCELEISRIYMSVYDFNKGAIKCYESCGFETVSSGRRTNGWNALVMIKQITR